ncbi:MAG TPA: hypothetical protein VKG84_03890 [Candidatus Acidoferrales bacterium]|nr:hypothetical protein [Candidatus Acidoferrales bacterium]
MSAPRQASKLRVLFTAASILVPVVLLCATLGRTSPASPFRQTRPQTGRINVDLTVPAWKADLRSNGFESPPSNQMQVFRPFDYRLSFAGERVLIATFTSREDVTSLVHRNDPNRPMPWKLHGVFLDAETGSVRGTKEWRMTRGHSAIIGRGDGTFAVLTPAFVASCLPDLKTCKEFRFSSEQAPRLWLTYLSPTGRSLLMGYQGHNGSFEWFDTDSMQRGPRWEGNMAIASISDSAAVFTKETYAKPQGTTREILVRPKDGPQRTLCSALLGHDNVCGGSPTLVSNDILALTERNRLRLIPGDGSKTLLTMYASGSEWLRAPIASADGARVAVTVWVQKGGRELFDISSHGELKRIEIYDVLGGGLLYALKAKRFGVKSIDGLALSPNGSSMAILADGIVSVYKLPVP